MTQEEVKSLKVGDILKYTFIDPITFDSNISKKLIIDAMNEIEITLTNIDDNITKTFKIEYLNHWNLEKSLI